MNETINLGKILATARRKCDLTQQELCSQTGIAYSTLTKIERGAIKKPNVFTVFKIAQATNLSVEKLLGSKDATPTATQQPPTTVEVATAPPRPIRFVYFDLHQVLIFISGARQCQLGAKALGTTTAVLEHLKILHENRLLIGQITVEEFNDIICRQTGGSKFDWQQLYVDVVRPNEAMQAFMQALTSQTNVGLLTNAYKGNVQALMDNNKVPKNFKVIVDSSEVGLQKPQAEIYEYAQKMANVAPAEILLIDDHPTNILAAQKKGWQGYCYRPGLDKTLTKQLQTLFKFGR